MRWILLLGATLFLAGCEPPQSTSDIFEEYNRAAAMPTGMDADAREISVLLQNDGADSLLGLRLESPTKAIAYVTKAGKRGLKYYVVLSKNGGKWAIDHTYYDWLTEPYETIPPVGT